MEKKYLLIEKYFKIYYWYIYEEEMRYNICSKGVGKDPLGKEHISKKWCIPFRKTCYNVYLFIPWYVHLQTCISPLAREGIRKTSWKKKKRIRKTVRCLSHLLVLPRLQFKSCRRPACRHLGKERLYQIPSPLRNSETCNPAKIIPRTKHPPMDATWNIKLDPTTFSSLSN